MNKKPYIDYTLYLVTDRSLMSTPDLPTAVEQAVSGGCTLVQLREKDVSSLEFYRIAQDIKAVTRRFNVPLIINDRIDIALAVDAEGVHIGHSDLPTATARKLIGSGKILGVSVSSLNEAIQAQDNGADYLGVGAMYATGTKTDAKLVSMAELIRIRNRTTLPVVVIGGINKKTIPKFHGIADGLAVVSAVISEPDIRVAAEELKILFR